eukprot:2977372-Prorocentrum_lima.AAC.1
MSSLAGSGCDPFGSSGSVCLTVVSLLVPEQFALLLWTYFAKALSTIGSAASCNAPTISSSL